MTQHPSGLAHHFDTLEQQREAGTLGMWAFLATEIMLFGGVFMGYMVYRTAFPEVFVEGSHHLNMPLGTINTVILLVSSLTVALAVHAAEHGRRQRMVGLLLVTIVLGLSFLGIKAVEYGEKFSHCFDPASHECLVPGDNFKWPGSETELAASPAGGAAGEAGHGAAEGESFVAPPGSQVVAPPQQPPPIEVQRFQLFFSLYFVATGLHAIHMIIGSVLLAVIDWIGWRGGIPTHHTTLIENGGLYWHLIDIIWVFLFPLFYLVH